MCPITINNVETTGFLDMGSGVSIVSSGIAKLCDLKIRPTKMNVFAGNVGRMSIIGESTAKISLGPQSRTFTVYIQDREYYDVLIGRDFLFNIGYVGIDPENHCVHVGKQQVPLGVTQETRVKESRVSLVQSTKLPENSVVNLLVTAPAVPNSDLSTFLFEPKELKKHDDVLPIRSFHEFDQVKANECQFAVQVINPQPFPVQLYKGTTLGKLEFCEDSQETFCDKLETKQEDILDKTDDSNLITEKRIEQILERIDLTECDITDQQRQELRALISEFPDVFALSDRELQCTNIVQHTINTGDHSPLKQRVYRLPFAQREAMRTQTRQMFEDGVIRVSQSPWLSPVLMVNKKDGSMRFCVDLRKVNSVTKKDSFQLPNISDILDSLHGTKYHSVLDLRAGYWQVPIAECDKEKTAFSTPDGLFEFNVMAFGLSNAPATFMRLMSIVLAGLDFSHCFIDDTLVSSCEWMAHLQHLRTVFERFRKFNLRLKPEKCTFCKAEVKYLGHVISREGVKVDPTKVEKVKNWIVPTSKDLVKSFYGLCSYYRRYVFRFAIIAAPLTNLLRKDRKFFWTKDCMDSFTTLKDKLCTAPILIFPDFTKDWIVQTDASFQGIAGILSQLGEDQNEHPVYYASRTLTSCERRYSVYELECLAIVFSIKTFKPYIFGHKVILETDHAPLKFLNEAEHRNNRIARWSMTLMGYDLTIRYKPGKTNNNADALSRMYELNKSDDKPSCVVSATQAEATTSEDFFLDEQLKDPFLLMIYNYLTEHKLPTGAKIADRIKNKSIIYSIHNGRLCVQMRTRKTGRADTNYRTAVPQHLTGEIMRMNHDHICSGHFGYQRTMDKIRLSFYWPSMITDIEKYCNSCKLCQERKTPRPMPRAEITPIEPTGPFETLVIDHAGPLPLSLHGNRHILVAGCPFTKFMDLFPVPDTSAATTARVLVTEYMMRYGIPRRLQSDRGSGFMSELVKEVCKTLGCEKISSTSFRPQTQGFVERFNATLATMVSMYIDDPQDNWDDGLPFHRYAYNSSRNSSTGESPAYLTFGRDFPPPLCLALTDDVNPRYSNLHQYKTQITIHLRNAWAKTKAMITKVQLAMKQQHDKKVHDKHLDIGDEVLIFVPLIKIGRTKKFTRRWKGPYRILDLNYPNFYVRLSSNPNAKPDWIHSDRCKPFIPRDESDFVNLPGQQDFLNNPIVQQDKDDSDSDSDSIELDNLAADHQRINQALDKNLHNSNIPTDHAQSTHSEQSHLGQNGPSLGLTRRYNLRSNQAN